MKFRSEAEFQETVLSLAKILGVKWYHTHRSDRSVAGFLDLVLVGRGGVLFREMKTATGTVSVEQMRWMAALTEAGQDAAVWRPEDWPVRITNELRAIGRSSFAGEAPETQQRRVRKKLASRARNVGVEE